MEFKPLFVGNLLRLAAPQDDDNEHFAEWTKNDNYLRIMDNDPARPLSATAHRNWEEAFINSPDVFHFRLRTLEDDRFIGMVILGGLQWTNQTANLGINIGDPANWGKGYGTDAMRLIVAYAFRELNLYRINSGTISYNIGSIRVHEKVGFKREGIQREYVQREGQRYDVIQFGLLRPDWIEHTGGF